MSAVSISVMPRSSARWIVRVDSSSSVSPYQADIPMQPRPSAPTSSPCPSFRVSMPRRYPQAGVLRLLAILAPDHGCPAAKNIQVAPRQTPPHPLDPPGESEPLRELRVTPAPPSPPTAP